MSDSVQPHRRQPTRLPRRWDSPGKNTGVGCHFLLQCMKVKSESEVTQSCPTLRDPMDCSLPGSSAHGNSLRAATKKKKKIYIYIYIHPARCSEDRRSLCASTKAWCSQISFFFFFPKKTEEGKQYKIHR